MLLDAQTTDNLPRGTICIEDIEIGMVRHLTKRVTDRDIELVAEVSTDRNPVHLDDAYARANARSPNPARSFCSDRRSAARSRPSPRNR